MTTTMYSQILEESQPYNYRQAMDGTGFVHKADAQNATMMPGCIKEYLTILQSNGYPVWQHGVTGGDKESET